jgi:hypothetical protein
VVESFQSCPIFTYILYFCNEVIYDLFMTAKSRRDFDALLERDTATLERPVAVQPYHSFTELRIEGGKIKLSPQAKRSVSITPSKGMLEEFVVLADADEHKFLEYAGRWGLLELCKEHYMPTSHNYNCEPIIPFRTVVFGTTDKAAKDHHKMLLAEGEPIPAWKDYARFAKALLNIAARLHQGEIGRDEDWETLHFDEAGYLGWNHATERRKAKKFPDLNWEKSLIADGVNFWLQIGGVQPKVSWETSRPIVTFECPKPYGKLFANLAIQLMMAVSQVDAAAVCSACGESYMPKRRPKSNQRRYCQNCKKIALRDASADYRRRKSVAG